MTSERNSVRRERCWCMAIQCVVEWFLTNQMCKWNQIMNSATNSWNKYAHSSILSQKQKIIIRRLFHKHYKNLKMYRLRNYGVNILRIHIALAVFLFSTHVSTIPIIPLSLMPIYQGYGIPDWPPWTCTWRPGPSAGSCPRRPWGSPRGTRCRRRAAWSPPPATPRRTGSSPPWPRTPPQRVWGRCRPSEPPQSFQKTGLFEQYCNSNSWTQ